MEWIKLNAQSGLAAPQAALAAPVVDNDMRLPSREAMQRQLPPPLLQGLLLDNAEKSAEPKPAQAPNAAQPEVTLSATARSLSALLALDFGAAIGPDGGAALGAAEAGAQPSPKFTAEVAPDSGLTRGVAIKGSQALLASAATGLPSAPLAAALTGLVAQSGLFYESHLLDWMTGKLSRAALLQEPQARLAERGLPAAGAGSAPVFWAAQTDQTDQTTDSAPRLLARLDSSLASDGRDRLDAALDKAGAAHTRPESDASAGLASAVHPAALLLVRQQLELLAMPQFRWSGEVWPGAPMAWEIQPETQRQPAPDGIAAPPASWRTQLRLTLPSLQVVDMALKLTGTQLELRLLASADRTLDLLGQRGPELAGRLLALGLAVSDLNISALDQPTRDQPLPASFAPSETGNGG